MSGHLPVTQLVREDEGEEHPTRREGQEGELRVGQEREGGKEEKG